MAATYDVGTRAWQPDAAEGWVASELISKTVEGSKTKLVFQLDNGEVKAYSPYSNSTMRDAFPLYLALTDNLPTCRPGPLMSQRKLSRAEALIPHCRR